MPRLFIAIEIPDDIKDELIKLNIPIPSARWVKPQQMHITLRFIGADIPDEKVEPIKSALSTVEIPKFDVKLTDLGRFPPNPKRSTRVLWVGMDKQPLLNQLHHKIESVLKTVGFPPDAKKFSPHLTLARLKASRTPDEVETFLSQQADFRVFTVSRFVLFRSELSPQGATYTKEAIYSLKG